MANSRKTEIVHLEYQQEAANIVENIKDEYLKTIASLYDDLSDSIFDDFKTEMDLNDYSISIDIEDLKKTLSKTIADDFATMWEDLDVNTSLIRLNLLKKLYEKDLTPKWRPMGKTPEEQVKAYRLDLLEKKIEFLKSNNDHQRVQLENMFVEIEKGRETISNILYQQQSLKPLVAEQLERLSKNEKELTELRFKVNSLSEDLN